MREKESGKNKTDLVVLRHGGRKTVRATSPPCFPTSSVGTSLNCVELLGPASMTDTQHSALTGETLAFWRAVLRAWNKGHEGIFPDFR